MEEVNNNKKYGYNPRFNKNNLGYSTREFNEDKKRENKDRILFF